MGASASRGLAPSGYPALCGGQRQRGAGLMQEEGDARLRGAARTLQGPDIAKGIFDYVMFSYRGTAGASGACLGAGAAAVWDWDTSGDFHNSVWQILAPGCRLATGCNWGGPLKIAAAGADFWPGGTPGAPSIA